MELLIFILLTILACLFWFGYWLGLRIFGYSIGGIALSVVFVVAALLLLPLWQGVWLPDIFSGQVRTLAATKLANKIEFRVVQYWNYEDFYTTELWLTLPDDRKSRLCLDADDSKTWQVPMSVDVANRTVCITLSGSRYKTVDWSADLDSPQPPEVHIRFHPEIYARWRH